MHFGGTVDTTEAICLVPLGTGECDWFRADRRAGSFTVTRTRIGADCVLPV